MAIELQPIELFSGISMIIWVSISTILGLLIASKYFTYKKRVFLLVGISWIFISFPWVSTTISFILALTAGQMLPEVIWFTIALGTIPIGIFTWLWAVSDLLYKERQKLILLIIAIEGALFYVYLFVSLSINTSLIGSVNSVVDTDYKPIVMLYIVSVLIILLTTGIQFARNSLRSDDPEMKLKGRLLIVAFISYSVGAILDSALPLDVITLPITRIILISSAIEFYGGFILPNWMKKLFLKEERS